MTILFIFEGFPKKSKKLKFLVDDRGPAIKVFFSVFTIFHIFHPNEEFLDFSYPDVNI